MSTSICQNHSSGGGRVMQLQRTIESAESKRLTLTPCRLRASCLFLNSSLYRTNRYYENKNHRQGKQSLCAQMHTRPTITI